MIRDRKEVVRYLNVAQQNSRLVVEALDSCVDSMGKLSSMVPCATKQDIETVRDLQRARECFQSAAERIRLAVAALETAKGGDEDE